MLWTYVTCMYIRTIIYYAFLTIQISVLFYLYTFMTEMIYLSASYYIPTNLIKYTAFTNTLYNEYH